MECIFLGGPILTMNPATEGAEAIAIKDGIIVKVGTFFECKQSLDHPMICHLKGNTLMPGFCESHSYLYETGLVKKYYLDCSPNQGDHSSFEKLLENLKKRAENSKVVFASNYDPNDYPGSPTLTRELLDSVSRTVPILVNHYSAHRIYVNTKVLELLKNEIENYKDRTRQIDPIKGYFSGTSVYLLWSHPGLNMFFLDNSEEIFQSGEEIFLKYGVTCANQGGYVPYTMFRELYENGTPNIRLTYTETDFGCDSPNKECVNNKLFFLGFKLTQDGSIPLKTAYLSVPYKGEEKTRYRGHAYNSRKELFDLALPWHSKGYQVYFHGNGDAAIDDIIYVCQKLEETVPGLRNRHTIINGQIVREDQLLKIKESDIQISFYTAALMKNAKRDLEKILDSQRISKMNPLSSAMNLGIKCSSHSYAPTMTANPFLRVRACVTRKDKNGEFYDDREGISVYEALKMVTIYGAYQNRLESKIGSLEQGKYADFIVLDQNPLKIPVDTLPEIKVLYTFIGGKCVYQDSQGGV